MKKDWSTLCLVGYGYWGKKLAIVMSQFSDRLFVYDSKMTDFPPFLTPKTWPEILKDVASEHVFLATPETTHFLLACKLLTSNKHVFVEKPLALKKIHTKKLCNLAEIQEKTLFCDYIFLFDPFVKKIKSVLDSCELGSIQEIESVRHSVGFKKEDIDVTEDLAIHDLYLAEYFSDSEVKKCTFILGTAKKNQLLAGVFLLESKNGVKLKSDCSWTEKKPKRKMTFYCEKGKVIWERLENGKSVLWRELGTEKKEIVVEDTTSALDLSVQYFLKECPRETKEQRWHRYNSYIRHVAMLESVRGTHSTF